MWPKIVEENGVKGYWQSGIFYAIGTQVIIPAQIKEKWFVYDYDNNLRMFDSEQDAKNAFLKVIADFRDEAIGDEWCDEVENTTWGKVFQTTKLAPVKNLSSEEDESDTVPYDAFAIEHRPKVI